MVDRSHRTAAAIATLVALPVAVLVGVLVFWLLKGAEPAGDQNAAPSPSEPQPTSSVSVSPPPLSERAAVVCRALLAKLPPKIRDMPQRPVTTGAEQVAAYGSPPVILTCGVPEISRDPTVMPFVASGVCWYPQRTTEGTTLTTIDREVPLELRVPADYEGPLQVAGEFADTITTTVPTVPTPPRGCR